MWVHERSVRIKGTFLLSVPVNVHAGLACLYQCVMWSAAKMTRNCWLYTHTHTHTLCQFSRCLFNAAFGKSEMVESFITSAPEWILLTGHDVTAINMCEQQCAKVVGSWLSWSMSDIQNVKTVCPFWATVEKQLAPILIRTCIFRDSIA